MARPTRVWSRVFVSAALLLPACGGGGGSTTVGMTTLQGRLVLRDGEAANLDGVQVALVETGATTTTAADGTFTLDVAGEDSAHLEFDDPSAGPAPDDPSDPCGADPTPDPSGIEGGGVRLDDLASSSVVEIEVEMMDGVVTALRTTRPLEGGETDDDGVGRLECVDGSGAEGFARLHGNPETGFILEIVASGLPAGVAGEFELTDPHGTAATGSFGQVVDGCGGAYMILLFGYDPVDPSNTTNPEGWGIVLRSGPGEDDILVGVVPPAGTDD